MIALLLITTVGVVAGFAGFVMGQQSVRGERKRKNDEVKPSGGLVIAFVVGLLLLIALLGLMLFFTVAPGSEQAFSSVTVQ